MLKIIKWIAIVFVGLVVIAMIFGDDKKGSSSGSSSSESAESAPTVEPYRTTARELAAAYEENEVATDMRIDKRPVEITGVVKAITKDFTDDVVIQLATSNQFMSASINLADGHESTAANLKKGQKVTFLCQKMMSLMGSPAGRDCQPL